MRAGPLVVACLLSACDAYDGALISKVGLGVPPRSSGSGGAAGSVIAGRAGSAGTAQGGSSSPDACATAIEECNGQDDDCDTRADERATCSAANAVAVCMGGACALMQCSDGFLDCNESLDDGCEAAEAGASCPSCPALCPDTPMLDASTDSGPMTPADSGTDSGPPDSGPPPDPCVQSAPTGRGQACDECACAQCAAELDDCNFNPDTTLAMKCADLVECYRENMCRNCGGTSMSGCTDCYDNGSGPCVAEVRIAAGGVDGNDMGPLADGNCTMLEPEVNACRAATELAACREMNCMADCP